MPVLTSRSPFPRRTGMRCASRSATRTSCLMPVSIRRWSQFQPAAWAPSPRRRAAGVPNRPPTVGERQCGPSCAGRFPEPNNEPLARRRGCGIGGGGGVTAGADSEITELTVNDHACLTFGEPEELFDLTAAFVRDGLSGGLKVVWISDAGPERVVSELVRRGIAVKSALATGQMAAAECQGHLLSGQVFSADHAMGWLSGQMAACQQEGFPG